MPAPKFLRGEKEETRRGEERREERERRVGVE